ncbi:MAG: hypothetical protein V3T21_03515 [Candidatus Margulisiibacteriota bacterium]
MDVQGISSAIIRSTAGQTSDDKKFEAAKEKVKGQVDYAISVVESLIEKFPEIKCDARKIDHLKFLLEKIDIAKNIKELKDFQGCAKSTFKYLHEQLVMQSRTASNELKDEILEDKEDAFGLGAFTSQKSLKDQETALIWLCSMAEDLKESNPYKKKAVNIIKDVADEYGSLVADLNNKILFRAVGDLTYLNQAKPEYLVEFLLDRLDSLENGEVDSDLRISLRIILNKISKNFAELKHEKIIELCQALEENEFIILLDKLGDIGAFFAAVKKHLMPPIIPPTPPEKPVEKPAAPDKPRKITDISMVSSMADLLTLYGEKDKNRNGKLEVGELSEKAVKANDKTNDNALSPWEAMGAVNSSRSKPVFSETMIELQGREGFADTVYPKTDSFINGIKYKGGGEDGFVILDQKTGQVTQGTLAAGNKIYGIEFKAGSVLTLEKGRPVAVLLSENTTVQNIEYKKGENIVFRKNGRIFSGYLAKNTTLKVGEQDIVFSVGSSIFFDKEGRIQGGTLANDAPLQVGKQNITFMAGGRISFDIKGKIWYGILAQETALQINEQNISFKSDTPLEFWSNGQVKYGTLAQDLTILAGKQKIILKQGSVIDFYENGQIKWGTSVKNVPVWIGKQKIILKQGENLGFHENGQVKYGKLAKNTRIRVGKQRITFMKEKGLSFDENGQVTYGTLAKNIRLRVGKWKTKIPFKKEGTIRFHENGQLASGILASNIRIRIGKQKISFKKGEQIRFHDNGQIAGGVIRFDTTIEGKKYKKETWVKFPKKETPAAKPEEEHLKLAPLAPTKDESAAKKEPAAKPQAPPPDTSQNPEAGEDKLIEEMENLWKEGK